MGLQSSYAEKVLSALHENVHFIRHPIVSPLLWSHHQKVLVVDQDVAFVGGLEYVCLFDCCFLTYAFFADLIFSTVCATVGLTLCHMGSRTMVVPLAPARRISTGTVCSRARITTIRW
jgi:Phospholipase D Active site motif